MSENSCMSTNSYRACNKQRPEYEALRRHFTDYNALTRTPRTPTRTRTSHTHANAHKLIRDSHTYVTNDLENS